MPEAPNISRLTDHLFRREAGKMVSVLARIFGTENLELAEDVVQDTFVSAMRVWPLKGIPDNPSAWLFRVAKNKALDFIRRARFTQQLDFSEPERKLLQSEYTLVTVMETYWDDAAVQDDLLKMMFACCQPGISTESQITLMLKTLCGFSIAEIARAFVCSEAAVSKRLVRTKDFFRRQKIRLQFPETGALKSRLEAVLKTIYLLFNEGYNATHTDEVIRKDLIEQAMYLCRLLCDNSHTQLPEAYAAMGLMCFHAARVDSRISPEGEIILLAQQNRSTWSKELIASGNRFMNLAASGDSVSTYHLEAAIAYQHCIAESFEQTNWVLILRCYDWLVELQPSAIVLLNRLTIIFKLHGGEAVLHEIGQSPHQREWEQHYLYHSLLGEIYAAGDKKQARQAFEQAMLLTQSKAEKKLLQKKIDGL